MKNDGRKIYTVSELNLEIRVVMEDTWPDIWLEGEVSNFRAYPSGHWYFSLKDQDAQISAVMFAGVNRLLKFAIEDGGKIIVRGRVSAYAKRGEYQFIALVAEPSGKGALQLAFEQLKAKLDKEGLFDQSRKKPIPMLPQRIGVITSPAGAAIRDILSVISRRFANVSVLLYPVRVQGDEAKYDITAAINYFNKHCPEIDVLLVGRGGGSYEDLWAFNEEIVARAIADSRIPIISCVGHEVDFTIADFVADLRAATPSAAAELVVRNKTELTERVDNLKHSLVRTIRHQLEVYEHVVAHATRSRFLQDPLAVFESRMQDIDTLMHSLSSRAANILESSRHAVSVASEKLHVLSPLSTLQRGYAICWKLPERTIVTDEKCVQRGDEIDVKVARGSFKTRVM